MDLEKAGAIITNRFIMIIAAKIISQMNSYYTVWPCAKILSAYGNAVPAVMKFYPECAAYLNGTSPLQQVTVHASMNAGTPVAAGAALNVSFGMALWVATVIHAVGVEIYVSFLFLVLSFCLDLSR
jgi:hypothetical protein